MYPEYLFFSLSESGSTASAIFARALLSAASSSASCRYSYRCAFSISFTVRFVAIPAAMRSASVRQYGVARHWIKNSAIAHGSRVNPPRIHGPGSAARCV